MPCDFVEHRKIPQTRLRESLRGVVINGMSIFRRNPPPTSPPAPVALPPGTPPKLPKAAEQSRAAPEPLTIVLPAIAALGAIASIAAVAYLAEDRTADRPRVKRRIDVILRDLETSCLGTAEILRRVIRHSPMFGLLGTASTPMRFGIVGARVDAQQSQMFIHLVNDVATMLVLATQAAFDATNAIEDGEITPPEELFDRFGEAQQKLNALLATRANIRTQVEGALALAEALSHMIRELKTQKPAGHKT